MDAKSSHHTVDTLAVQPVSERCITANVIYVDALSDRPVERKAGCNMILMAEGFWMRIPYLAEIKPSFRVVLFRGDTVTKAFTDAHKPDLILRSTAVQVSKHSPETVAFSAGGPYLEYQASGFVSQDKYLICFYF